jgi:uncharacterized YigZ family protein
MPELFSYHTINAPSEGLFKDRGSKFLAFAYPVLNEEQIKVNLLNLRKLHPSARHHCYAWRLGPTKELSRANDDGEPANSAGKPILTQLQANNLYNSLIVVIRYFGGTLLGVNGLINAYKNAAANALLNATISEQFILNEYKLSFDADEQGTVMRLLKEMGSKQISNHYDVRQEIVFRVKKQKAELLETKFKELYKTKLELIQTL